MNHCPLCKSNDVEKIDSVDTDFLARSYARNLEIDIRPLLITKIIAYNICHHCTLGFYDPPITGDNQFYQSLQKNSWYYLEERPEYNLIEKYIVHGEKILEIGCGEGAFAKYTNGCQYTGLDTNFAAVNIARNNGVNVINDDIETHARQNHNQYDLVCSFQVVEHVPDISGLLKASWRCLQENGIMIIAVPAEDSLLVKVYNNLLNMPPHHITRWSDRALRSIPDYYSFDLVELIHEPVAKIHAHLFRSAQLFSRISTFLAPNPLILDRRLRARIANKIAEICSRIFPFYPAITAATPGHTVVAIYRKRR